ncbi:MAG: Phosphate transport ATP-binding protein PstB, partial [uncultured Friedmanniella sp.]
GQPHHPRQRQRLLRRVPRDRRHLHGHRRAVHHGVHRPVRLWQVDGAAHHQPHARGDPRRPRRGHHRPRRRRHLRAGHRPGRRAPSRRHGLPAAQPVPDDVHLRQRRRRAQAERPAQEERDRRGRRDLAEGRQPVGGGQGPPRPPRCGAVRRPAAAAVHRPRHRRQAAGAAHGRAGVGPRPDLHAGDRGPDDAAEERLHDRHRHPQHAAGGAGLRPHRLLQHRGHRPAGPPRRDRRHAEDLQQPGREEDRGLHHRSLRL